MNTGTGMKRAKSKRRSAIIAELSRLSRNGWERAIPADYEPLERELRELNGATP